MFIFSKNEISIQFSIFPLLVLCLINQFGNIIFIWHKKIISYLLSFLSTKIFRSSFAFILLAINLVIIFNLKAEDYFNSNSNTWHLAPSYYQNKNLHFSTFYRNQSNWKSDQSLSAALINLDFKLNYNVSSLGFYTSFAFYDDSATSPWDIESADIYYKQNFSLPNLLLFLKTETKIASSKQKTSMESEYFRQDLELLFGQKIYIMDQEVLILTGPAFAKYFHKYSSDVNARINLDFKTSWKIALDLNFTDKFAYLSAYEFQQSMDYNKTKFTDYEWTNSLIYTYQSVQYSAVYILSSNVRNQEANVFNFQENSNQQILLGVSYVY